MKTKLYENEAYSFKTHFEAKECYDYLNFLHQDCQLLEETHGYCVVTKNKKAQKYIDNNFNMGKNKKEKEK